MGAIGKPFMKMRRRLTVTGSSGASENIDGLSDKAEAPSQEEVQATHNNAKYQAVGRVTDVVVKT